MKVRQRSGDGLSSNPVLSLRDCLIKNFIRSSHFRGNREGMTAMLNLTSLTHLSNTSIMFLGVFCFPLYNSEIFSDNFILYMTL